ncbi:ras protein, partial [Mycena galericulata]
MEEWKIAMIGDVGVGKISFAFQVHEIDPTLDEIYRSQVVVDDRTCTVELLAYPADAEWANRLTYTAQAWVLVYSITSRASFDHLIALSPQVATHAKLEGGPVLVVLGNKCDLHEARREVQNKEGEELARRFDCQFYETSAKTGQNVGRVITDLVRRLRQPRPAISGVDGGPQKREETRKKTCVIL